MSVRADKKEHVQESETKRGILLGVFELLEAVRAAEVDLLASLVLDVWSLLRINSDAHIAHGAGDITV